MRYPVLLVVSTLFLISCSIAEPAPPAIPTFQRGIDHWQHRYATQDYPRYTWRDLDAIAANVLAFQNEDGGWPKNHDMLRVLTEQERARIASRPQGRSTIDNDATYIQVAFLSAMYRRTGVLDYRRAAERGLDWLLDLQNPSGGWKGADVDAITFNDDATTMMLNLLLDIHLNKPYVAWLDGERRQRSESALQRGIAVVLACQVVVDGVRTVWAQQHDHKTLVPVGARSYELPGLTARESVGIVRFLMRVEEPSAKIIEAIESAVRWFEQARIPNLRLERVATDPLRFNNRIFTEDVRVVSDEHAPPLWARYYDLETGLPFFANRDGIKVHRLGEVVIERRLGYQWYGAWPATLLETEYPAWAKTHGRSLVIPSTLRQDAPSSTKP